jgi:hypothetical protein
VAEVPAVLLEASAPQSPPAVAEVTLDLEHGDQGRRFSVLVASAEGAAPVEAGAITVFSHHTGPTTFSVPLPPNLAPAGQPNAKLEISVVPIGGPGAESMSAMPTMLPRSILKAINVKVPAQT